MWGEGIGWVCSVPLREQPEVRNDGGICQEQGKRGDISRWENDGIYGRGEQEIEDADREEQAKEEQGADKIISEEEEEKKTYGGESKVFRRRDDNSGKEEERRYENLEVVDGVLRAEGHGRGSGNRKSVYDRAAKRGQSNDRKDWSGSSDLLCESVQEDGEAAAHEQLHQDATEASMCVSSVTLDLRAHMILAEYGAEVLLASEACRSSWGYFSDRAKACARNFVVGAGGLEGGKGPPMQLLSLRFEATLKEMQSPDALHSSGRSQKIGAAARTSDREPSRGGDEGLVRMVGSAPGVDLELLERARDFCTDEDLDLRPRSAWKG